MEEIRVFVDSGFVKICDEYVHGHDRRQHHGPVRCATTHFEAVAAEATETGAATLMGAQLVMLAASLMS